MLIPLVPTGAFAAASDHPIRMTAEPDPDCVLSGPGTLSYVRFVIQNTGDEAYTLYNPVLSSEVLDEDQSLYPENGNGEAADAITLKPGTVREFRIIDVYMPESALNTDVRFTLSWEEEVYSYSEEDEEWEEPEENPEPEEDPYPDEEYPDEEEDAETIGDGDELQRVQRRKKSAEPEVTYVRRNVSAVIFIATEEVPDMGISVKVESSLVETDETVRVRYVLTNTTVFDFEDITLTDAAAGGEIELEETVLRAGESMTAEHSFTMGEENAVLCPEATYTVRGRTYRTQCKKAVTVEYMYDNLTLDVQQYTPAETGTLFSLTVTNTGTHRMREVQIRDDAGTTLCEPFSLDPGQSRLITYTYGSYTGLSENRRVSFTIYAKDSEGESRQFVKPGSYEVRPYVSTDQVSLLMNVTMTGYEEETNTVQLLFEIRNYSDVAISNAVIMETEVLKTPVHSYPTLTKGVTTFTMDFQLGEGVSILTFLMDADDAGGTHYQTPSVSLQVDRLALSVKTGTFGSAANTVIDTSGTVFDTDKYRSYIETGLLSLLLAAAVFILISGMFRGAEKLVRKDIPESDPVSRITGAGSVTQDTARLRFGYVKPAKLRYAQEITVLEPREPEARTNTGSTGAGRITSGAQHSTSGTQRNTSGAQRNRSGAFRTGAASAQTHPDTGKFIKPRKQVKMLTKDDTVVFEPPVAPRHDKAAFISDYSRKKAEAPGFKKSVTVRIPAVSLNGTPEAELAEPKQAEIKKAPEKRLTMSACLSAGKPYSFETEPLPAVIPATAEPEIVIIKAPSPLA